MYIQVIRGINGNTYYQHVERYKDDLGKWQKRTRTATYEDYKRYKASQEVEKRRKMGSQLDKDATSPIVPNTQVSKGDWWQLGKHRLYCGDTSNNEFIKSLPLAKLAFADPPYNAGVSEWDNDFIWSHDWLSDKADIIVVTPGIASLFEFARNTSMPYQWAIACWISNGMTRGKMGFGNWIFASVFSKGNIYANSQDFIKVTIDNSATIDTNHKGRKPSQFMIWLLNTFTKVNDIIIDPFLGSGTTLLTAENRGRICYGGEIVPDFCSEIISRWENITFKKALKIS